MTTSTDTRTAQMVTCPDCDHTTILEPRANFPRTWWVVTADNTSQAPSHKAAKERARLHRNRPSCGSPLRTENITDFVMPEHGDMFHATFASIHAS